MIIIFHPKGGENMMKVNQKCFGKEAWFRIMKVSKAFQLTAKKPFLDAVNVVMMGEKTSYYVWVINMRHMLRQTK